MPKFNELIQKGGYFEKAGSIVILIVLKEKKKVLFEDLVALSGVSRSTVALRLKEFLELGWITKKEIGRNSEYQLTNSGKELAKRAIELVHEAIKNSNKKIQINLLNNLAEKISSSITDYKSIISVVQDLSNNGLQIVDNRFVRLDELTPFKLSELGSQKSKMEKVANELLQDLNQTYEIAVNEKEIMESLPKFKSALDTRYKKSKSQLTEYLSLLSKLN